MRPTTEEKIKLFASLFPGLDKAYGTYEPNTGRHWQIMFVVVARSGISVRVRISDNFVIN